MTQPRDPDSIIATWLDDGPVDLPAETRRAIVVGLRTQPRARRMALVGGYGMTPLMRFATAAVIAIAVGTVSIFVLANRGSGPGAVSSAPPPSATVASPSPSPAPSASARLLDTTGWATFVSERYGFTIGRPPAWTVEPATVAWSFEKHVKAWEHLETTDHFNNAEGSIGVSAWSSPIAPGTTVDAYIDAYCRAVNEGGCAGLVNQAVSVQTKDGHLGQGLFVSDFDTMIFVRDGQTMYVIGVWRGETDPLVAPYGGARRLLESIVSTMTLQTPEGSPSAS